MLNPETIERVDSNRRNGLIVQEGTLLYIGTKAHERNSQLPILKRSGALVTEKKSPAGNLESFI